MNTIFTLRRIAVAAVLCIIASTSVLAADYKPMIRYDRVWEHISVYWDDTQVYYVKFNGVEEINGKTYHRLKSFRKSGYAYDNDRHAYLFDTDDHYYRHEGYLREEDGKVYVLVLNPHPEEEIQIYYQLLRWSPKSEDLPYVTEKLLYDFTCKEGETYRGLHVDGEAEEMTYKVKSIESVEIDGEAHRLLRVTPEEYDYIELQMVEGVGIDSEYGCLTTINFLHIPTCPCRDYIFHRLLSIDGRRLYGSESDIPVGDFLGVDNLTKPSEDDTPMYDIMGRRISRPAPGQLYIQGGKKKIAPKR